MTDWTRYQKCSVCGAPIGEPCAAMTVGFVTEAYRVIAREAPHSTRPERAESTRTGGDRG